MFPTPNPASFEEALLDSLVAERRLSEERALLPGLLHHGLANVLCQVSLAASLLGATRTEAERAGALRDIHGGVKRMDDLLAGMRLLYLNRGGVDDFARADLAGFVTKLVREPGVWPAGPAIALELPATMWCSFSPTLVRHALVNLIGNAVAYSQGTWVRVRLSLVRGDRWLISVANGGPGIPANHVPYLFELSRRANVAAKSAQPGLGLYIARMCLRFHSSELRVRSRPRLTVFAFGLEGAQRGAGMIELRRG
jgi:signal transduction histidine kinase